MEDAIKIYEYFGDFGGNDDFLSDAGDTKDIIYGMRAWIPYGASEGEILYEEINVSGNTENKCELVDFSDEKYIDELASLAAKYLNLPNPQKLGGGSFGVAYSVGNDKVLKLTTDGSEMYSATKLVGKDTKHLAKIYGFYKLFDSTNNKCVYAILQEKVANTNPDLLNNYVKYIDKIASAIGDNSCSWGDIAVSFSPRKFNETKMMECINKIKNAPITGASDITPQIREEVSKFLMDLVEIRKELDQYSIISSDFTNIKNLSYDDNNVLKFFDIGGYYKYNKEDIENLEKIKIKENGSSKFSSNKSIGQDEYPIYNQNDTSSLIDNNIITNEDLEYHHVNDATKDNYIVDEERKMAWMPGAKKVEVKSKCKLGGLGSTSAPCNQGDIRNLKFIDIVEQISNDVINQIKKDTENLSLNKKFVRYEDDTKVMAINGDNARDIGFIEFVDGGHHYVDVNKRNKRYAKYIPEDEIWIDDVFLMKPNDMEAIILHEKLERKLMKDYDYSYNKAHDIANKAELLFRKKVKRGRGRMLSDMIYNKFLEKYGKDKSEDINETQKIDKNKLNKIFNGKRDLAYVELTKNDFNEIKNKGFGILPIRMTNGGVIKSIVYSDYSKGKELYDYIKKHGGHLTDKSPQEARYVGKLMGYDDLTIDEYIRRKYNNSLKKPKSELNGVPDEIKNVIKEEILSLDKLPFKNEILKLGGKIYSVGGAVRDEFLGKSSKDLDILITGIPINKLEEILSKYGQVNLVGKSFGILKFKPQNSDEYIDIAIPRTEKPTGDKGHKAFVITSDHNLPIEKDLLRRDFTINAIAKDVDGNIVDPFNGIEDLNNKVIRMVNPNTFDDDPLRMLRAVQFASRFGFTIEPNTLKSIQKNAYRIKEIPSERILTEFDKIIKKGDKFKGALLLKQTGLLENIFNGDGDILADESIWNRVKTMGEFIWLLSHNIVPKPSEYFKNKLKGDIDTYKEIKALEMAFNAEENIDNKKARIVASNMYAISPKSLESEIIPNKIKIAANELLSGKYPKSITDLAINGNDLIKLKLKDAEIGKMLKSLLINIYFDKIDNNKNDIISFVEKNINSSEKIVSEIKNKQQNYDIWNVGGKDVDINFFVDEYYKWLRDVKNNNEKYKDPSEASVLEFLKNKYKKFSQNKNLRRKLYWELTDRDVLKEVK